MIFGIGSEILDGLPLLPPVGARECAVVGAGPVGARAVPAVGAGAVGGRGNDDSPLGTAGAGFAALRSRGSVSIAWLLFRTVRVCMYSPGRSGAFAGRSIDCGGGE